MAFRHIHYFSHISVSPLIAIPMIRRWICLSLFFLSHSLPQSMTLHSFRFQPFFLCRHFTRLIFLPSMSVNFFKLLFSSYLSLLLLTSTFPEGIKLFKSSSNLMLKESDFYKWIMKRYGLKNLTLRGEIYIRSDIKLHRHIRLKVWVTCKVRKFCFFSA